VTSSVHYQDLTLPTAVGRSDEFESQLEGACPTNSQERPPTVHSPAQLQKLQFLQLAEWNEHNSYGEDEPSCLHYSIEWKVSVNNRIISKDTEQDLVLVPSAYWHMLLKPKLEKLLRKKVAQNRHIRCEDTSVIVLVTDRTERDLVKRLIKAVPVITVTVDISFVELLSVAQSFPSKTLCNDRQPFPSR